MSISLRRGKGPDIKTSRRLLRCFVEGDSAPFTLTVSVNKEIDDLKVLIHGECQNGAMSGVDATDLVLLRVRSTNSYAKNAYADANVALSAQETDGVEAITDSWHAHSRVRHCVIRDCRRAG